MSKKNSHVSETPATQLLRAHKVEFTEHPYEYLEHGGTEHSAASLGLDAPLVVPPLVLPSPSSLPLLFLLPFSFPFSPPPLSLPLFSPLFSPFQPEVANRHSGYLVGGTSPFGTRRDMPVYIEESILALPRIAINGGRRGFLVQLDPQVCVRLLDARPVHCALAE